MGLCVVQVLVVALTGLLQTETARVWAFMLPLWMVPVGLELARWTWRGRAVAYACTWLLLAAAVQNMIFVTTPAMKPGAGENRATN